MTYEEFLRELARAPEAGFLPHWQGPVIRLEKHDEIYCPLTAVCEISRGLKLHTYEWAEAAEHLGLKIVVAGIIFDAADCILINKATVRARHQMQRALRIGSESDWKTALEALDSFYQKRFRCLSEPAQFTLVRDLLDLCVSEKLTLETGVRELNQRIGGALESYLMSLMARSQGT